MTKVHAAPVPYQDTIVTHAQNVPSDVHDIRAEYVPLKTIIIRFVFQVIAR